MRETHALSAPLVQVLMRLYGPDSECRGMPILEIGTSYPTTVILSEFSTPLASLVTSLEKDRDTGTLWTRLAGKSAFHAIRLVESYEIEIGLRTKETYGLVVMAVAGEDALKLLAELFERSRLILLYSDLLRLRAPGVTDVLESCFNDQYVIRQHGEAGDIILLSRDLELRREFDLFIPPSP